MEKDVVESLESGGELKSQNTPPNIKLHAGSIGEARTTINHSSNFQLSTGGGGDWSRRLECGSIDRLTQIYGLVTARAMVIYFGFVSCLLSWISLRDGTCHETQVLYLHPPWRINNHLPVSWGVRDICTAMVSRGL